MEKSQVQDGWPERTKGLLSPWRVKGMPVYLVHHCVSNDWGSQQVPICLSGPGRNTGGRRYGSLNVGEKRLGKRAKGRLGSRPEETARKGLILSGSWPARTVRAANHTECNPYTG